MTLLDFAAKIILYQNANPKLYVQRHKHPQLFLTHNSTASS
jgi:hypothetical protein